MTKQLKLKLEAANREYEQMLADINYKAATLPDDSALIINTQSPMTVETFSFDVLFNRRVKHTIVRNNRIEAYSRAIWIAKKGAEQGWPTSVRPTPSI